ncbi:hypothetical protein OK016_22580 [Vibrio chagasii]|nr:hypothetical protein [Vibrio chagasii]
MKDGWRCFREFSSPPMPPSVPGTWLGTRITDSYTASGETTSGSKESTLNCLRFTTLVAIGTTVKSCSNFLPLFLL